MEPDRTFGRFGEVSLGVWGGLGEVVWRVFRFGVSSFVILLGLGSPGGWVSGGRDRGVRKLPQ
jgi:hypothetical protein